jgi:predicted acyltransferase
VIAIAWLAARGGSIDDAAHGWLYLLIAGAAAELAGWVWTWRVPDGTGPYVVAGAGTVALLAGAVVREAPRIAMIEPPRTAAVMAGGLATFVATVALGIVAIAWIVQAIRSIRD